VKNFFCIWCGQPTELLATCCSETCEDALAAYNAERNAEILRRVRDGASAQTVAKEHGVSRDYVTVLLSAERDSR